MAVILASELQSDLESLYKKAGDLLNEIDGSNDKNHTESERQIIDRVRFELQDIAGTLQKDIFNVRHIIMKIQAGQDGA